MEVTSACKLSGTRSALASPPFGPRLSTSSGTPSASASCASVGGTTGGGVEIVGPVTVDVVAPAPSPIGVWLGTDGGPTDRAPAAGAGVVATDWSDVSVLVSYAGFAADPAAIDSPASSLARGPARAPPDSFPDPVDAGGRFGASGASGIEISGRSSGAGNVDPRPQSSGPVTAVVA